MGKGNRYGVCNRTRACKRVYSRRWWRDRARDKRKEREARRWDVVAGSAHSIWESPISPLVAPEAVITKEHASVGT